MSSTSATGGASPRNYVYRLQRHFVDCMLSGAPFESTGQDYLKTIEVVEAAYESAARSTVVRVDPARRRIP